MKSFDKVLVMNYADKNFGLFLKADFIERHLWEESKCWSIYVKIFCLISWLSIMSFVEKYLNISSLMLVLDIAIFY